MGTSIEEACEKALTTLKDSSNLDYIGEDISQLEHALQCAYFANKASQDSEEILAALFHDVGHYSESADFSDMGGYGTHDHEGKGERFLLNLGFSKRCAELVKNHVQAKRYLVAKNQKYADGLSSASRKTLEYQGGPMSPTELISFEKSDNFKAILRMRKWDEMAKETDLKVPDLNSYKQMILDHLKNNLDRRNNNEPL